MSTINAQNYGDGTESVPASAVLEGTAKGYVGLGVPGAAVEDFNVSSYTDDGTGLAQINWTSAFATNRYPVTTAFASGTTSANFARYSAWINTSEQTASEVRVEIGLESDATVSYADNNYHAVAYGDYA